MKIVLVFFNNLSTNKKSMVAYTSYSLVKKLYEEGMLERVICLDCDKGIDIPSEYVSAFQDSFFLEAFFKILNILQSRSRICHTRALREFIFDIYAARKLSSCGDGHVFCARPLFLRVIKFARKMGRQVWVQVLAPHPLLHYSLVRNEEISFSVSSRGGTTNISRTARLTKALNESDRVFTLSSEISGFTYKSYADLIEADKLVEINCYFSVDKSVYSPSNTEIAGKDSSTELVFVCVSFMNLTKGIPYLLAAWEILIDRYRVPGKLILIGRIDAKLQEIIETYYKHVPNVEYAGFVPDLAEQFRKSDVLVSPSVADAGPTTILEAFCAGLPVVASRNCGFSSLITEGQEGFTYDYNDIEQLAEIMHWFFDNRAALKAMKNNAVNRVMDFSIDKYTDELATTFKRLT